MCCMGIGIAWYVRNVTTVFDINTVWLDWNPHRALCLLPIDVCKLTMYNIGIHIVNQIHNFKKIHQKIKFKDKSFINRSFTIGMLSIY